MKRKRIDTPRPYQVNNKKLTTDKDGNFIAPNGTHLKNWIIEKTIQGGTFGKVIRCTQIGNSEVSVAIKTFKLKFTNCSKNEIKILKYLSENDPQGKEKIVRYIDDFRFNGHACIVCNQLGMNLYQVMKHRGKYTSGLPLPLIRKFAKQLFKTLHFIHTLPEPIIHCDLKPENICVKNNDGDEIHLIDFGISLFESKIDFKKYKKYPVVQSIYYRAMEVLLETPYEKSIDMWSVACILFELHTGKPLFNRNTTSLVISEIVQIMGIPPNELVDSSPISSKYFKKSKDSNWVLINNLKKETDKKMTPDNNLSTSLITLLNVNYGGPNGDWKYEFGHSLKDYQEFMELLKGILKYNPQERISAFDALQTDFCN